MNRAGLLIPLLWAACATSKPAPEAEPGPAAAKPEKPASSGTTRRKPTDRVVGFEHPSSWKEVEPSNFMRRAEFRIHDKEKEHPDAQLALFHFRVASPIEQNVKRWANQMGVGEPKPETFEGECPVTMVDLKGTYMGDSQNDPIGDARMLAAIVDAPDGQWFFKFIGPSGTVGDWRDEFVHLLKSVHR